MRGETSVRSAEDLESGALTYAEIKAIASGNPVVVEKIKIDTEIRKLDQLRTVHANQQRHIRWAISDIPRQIAEEKQHLADIEADIATRNAAEFPEFSMTVGNRVFSGKGGRESAANALTGAILSWRDDQTIQPRGTFRGFQILSRGKSGGFGTVQEEERIPHLFVRGRGTYSANLNPTNPVGTVQSIEHTLRNWDRLAAESSKPVSPALRESLETISHKRIAPSSTRNASSSCSPVSPSSTPPWISTKATNKEPTSFPISRTSLTWSIWHRQHHEGTMK